MSSFKELFAFTVSVPKEVDETNTRVEDGKTITETTKVTRSVSHPFCFKVPSRAEREEADIERAVWETKFVTAGILPQALLLKTYANYGGILSEEQKAHYNKLQADFLLAQTELQRLQVNDKDNTEAITAEATKLIDLRQAILDFQQEQSAFFQNTAEVKARQKLIEWLVLHLTYYKPVAADGTIGEWTSFFGGATNEAKLDTFDRYLEENNELFLKARDIIELVATIYASANGRVSKDEIESFARPLVSTESVPSAAPGA